jgi:hypothetical protein
MAAREIWEVSINWEFPKVLKTGTKTAVFCSILNA